MSVVRISVPSNGRSNVGNGRVSAVTHGRRGYSDHGCRHMVGLRHEGVGCHRARVSAVVVWSITVVVIIVIPC